MLYLDYTRSEKWIEMKPLKRKESLGYKIKRKEELRLKHKVCEALEWNYKHKLNKSVGIKV